MRTTYGIALLVISVLASCSGPDPVGTYATTPESFKKALEATLPQDDSPAAKAIRARAVGHSGTATLELLASGSFVYTVEQSGMMKPWERKGTWTQDGDSIVLQPEKEPEAWTASLTQDALTLQESSHSPRFVLEKKQD